MSIIVSDVSYRYSNRQTLLDNICFSVPSNGKVSVTGNNGTGKSTLLKLVAGELAPSSGVIHCSSRPYYIPQQAGSTGQSVYEALGVAEKIAALHCIYGGSGDPVHYDLLADDWDIEARCRSALDHWGLAGIDCDSPVDSLSGGERTKVFLAGLSIHEPDIILLDEPTNHLDLAGRRKLYDLIARCKATAVVVSHDIALLDMLETTYELSGAGMRQYGGNYTFYIEQKEMEESALAQRIGSAEAALRLARKKAREVKERQDKRTGRAGKSATGLPRIILGGRRGKGENTGAKLSEKHAGIIDGSAKKLAGLRQQQQKNCDLRIDFEDARLHNGKLLVEAVDMNFAYAGGKPLWQAPLNVEIRSGERIRIVGDNGTGKTTLIGLLTGELSPTEGAVRRSDFSYVCLDQQYSRVCRDIPVLELAREHNKNNLPDHEIRLRLDRALFPKETWDKNCLTLSGGERMRLYLCCLMISDHIPDMFILDEPTNNLDISSLSILTDTIRNYRGTVIAVSHDSHFVDAAEITGVIELRS